MSMTKDLLKALLRKGGKVEHKDYIRALKTVAIDAGTHEGNLRSELLRRGLIKHNHTVEVTDAGLRLLEKT